MAIPNRVMIAALDRALNMIDREINDSRVAAYTKQLWEDRDAVRAARNFIAEKRWTGEVHEYWMCKLAPRCFYALRKALGI